MRSGRLKDKGGDSDLPKLSKAFRTMSNDLNHVASNCSSFMFPCIGVILQDGLNA